MILLMSLVGAHFGFTVDGVPQGGIKQVPIFQPGTHIIIGHESVDIGFGDIWDYFSSMILFKVDNVPYVLNYVFVFMGLISLVILVSFALPGGGG